MRRFFDTATRIAFAAVLAVSSVEGSEPEAPEPEIAEALRSSGVPSEIVPGLAAALEQAADEERIEPLAVFFDSEEPNVVVVAAGLASQVDPESTLREIRRRVESGSPNSKPLLLTLVNDPSSNAISYLADLESRRSGEIRKAAGTILRVLTQTEPPHGQSWKTWWAENGRAFEIPLPDDEAELERRIGGEVARQTADQIESVANRIDPDDKALEGFSKLLGDLADGMRRGGELRLTQFAEQGDAAFRTSNYADAISAYRRAIEENPADDRSRYLLACLLLETGNAQQAAAEFQTLHRSDPALTSAVFLERLALRRQRNPGEDWVEAAFREFAAFSSKPEVGSMGWDDPVISEIMSQTMAGGGPLVGDLGDGRRLLAAATTSREKLSAISVMRPVERLPALRAALETDPDKVELLAAYVSAAQSSRNDADTVMKAAQRWAETEPDNALPALVLIETPRRAEKDPTFTGNAEDFDRLLAEVEGALQRPKFESHSKTRLSLGIEVRRGLRQPLLLSFGWGETSFSFLRTTQAVSSGGQKFLDAGDHGRARRAADLLVRWGERNSAETTSVIGSAMAEAKSTAGRQLLIKLERGAGNEEKALEWEQEQKNARIRLRKLADFAPVSLISLPVPGLVNALGQRFEENEIALVEFWQRISSE